MDIISTSSPALFSGSSITPNLLPYLLASSSANLEAFAETSARSASSWLTPDASLAEPVTVSGIVSLSEASGNVSPTSGSVSD